MTNATGEIKFNLQTSSAFTSASWAANWVSDTGHAVQDSFAVPDATVEENLATSFADYHGIFLSGLIRTNGAATVDFQWAQQNSSGTTTLLAGSWIRIIKVS